MNTEYDFLVLGSGMGGLTVASLLARAGRKVAVLEAHEHPGGCAHSFQMGSYTFCAAVHYIFYCGEGEPVYNWLRKLGLERQITFERLDPEGYDHFSCPRAGLRFRIPSGLEKWADRLIDRFPDERRSIARFFDVIGRLMAEARRMPFEFTAAELPTVPVRFPTLFRYRAWTLQRLFDRMQLSQPVQALLATQIGDVGLPPSQVSLVIFAALIWSYASGAYHPTRHFCHLIETVAGQIAATPGCAMHFNSEVARIEVRAGRVTGVTTTDGRCFTARTYISNIDPRRTVELAGAENFSSRFRRKVSYDYSVSAFTVYLGVRDLDLTQHGFGRWNIWHYPSLDLDATYRAHASGDLSDPWIFISTPTLFTPGHGDVCPPGQQIIELVTTCGYGRYAESLAHDRKSYAQQKKQAADRLIDVVEQYYVPNLRQHLVKKFAGSPTTNVRYLWAPRGNIYGSNLTPDNIHFGRLKYRTPLENLYFTGASSEFPSVGATVVGGARLYTHLTGESVNPGRDRYGLL